MAHALGEMYYLAGLMEERRQKQEQQKQEQGPHIHTGLVFISPRVPKEFDIIPADTGKQVETVDSEWCVIA
jgi:hypothetical protein